MWSIHTDNARTSDQAAQALSVPILIWMLAWAAPAMAQQVPKTVDPSRLQQNLEERQPPRAEPRVAIPLPEGVSAPQGSEALTFTYRGMNIEGAKALPLHELMALWPHQAGETARVDEVFAFANAISEAYRKAGYALSFALVPQQDVEERFTIRVVEGFVERIAFGAIEDGALKRQLERMAGPILASRPLRMAVLERSLLLMNDLPGANVAATLSPAEASGGAMLLLNAVHTPVEAALGYNNFMPDALGRDITEASFALQSLLTGSEAARFAVRHSLGGSAYRAASVDLSTGIGARGFRLGASGSWTKVDPEDDFLDALEYEGRSFGGRLYGEYPLLRSRERNLIVGAGLAADHTNFDILSLEFTKDRLRSATLYAAYDFLDATRAVTSISGTLIRGLDVLNATANSRGDGELEYTKLELEAQRYQPLAMAWGGSLSLVLAVHGQRPLGSKSLFSGAECAYGGRRFGKGFSAGAISGDECAQGSLELHWARPVVVRQFPQPMLFDFHAFADGGAVWQKGALQPDEAKRSDATSAGLGLNLHVTPKIRALIEVSKALSLSGGEPEDDVRVSGAFNWRF